MSGMTCLYWNGLWWDECDPATVRVPLPEIPESKPEPFRREDGVAMLGSQGRAPCPSYPNACRCDGYWPHVYFRLEYAEDEYDDSIGSELRAATCP